MARAVAVVLWLLYADKPTLNRPASSMIPPKTERNQAIVQRYLVGERAVDLAKEFGISVRRVNKLIRRYLDRGQE
jgi:Mor family transcriptional regulator